LENEQFPNVQHIDMIMRIWPVVKMTDEKASRFSTSLAFAPAILHSTEFLLPFVVRRLHRFFE
jgi:hypothetical protein